MDTRPLVPCLLPHWKSIPGFVVPRNVSVGGYFRTDEAISTGSDFRNKTTQNSVETLSLHHHHLHHQVMAGGLNFLRNGKLIKYPSTSSHFLLRLVSFPPPKFSFLILPCVNHPRTFNFLFLIPLPQFLFPVWAQGLWRRRLPTW